MYKAFKVPLNVLNWVQIWGIKRLIKNQTDAFSLKPCLDFMSTINKSIVLYELIARVPNKGQLNL